jgi:tetratricopeptide (TPR) repeat protein
LGRFEETIQYCDSALAIDPQCALAWNNKGDGLREVKRLEEALICYEKCLEYDPQFPEAWSGKALVEEQLGRHGQALVSQREFLMIDSARRQKERRVTDEGALLLRKGIYCPEESAAPETRRKAHKKLVCKRLGIGNSMFIYATPERAAFHSRIERALFESRTWGEFRKAMPPKEYSRIVREVFEGNDEPRPRASDAFSRDQVSGTEDLSYPTPMMEEMAESVLPQDLLDIYAEESPLRQDRLYYYVAMENVDELNAELRRRGYEIVDGGEFSILA